MLGGFPHGVFFRDTRFLSELCLRVNGEWPEPLAATTTDPFSAAFVLRAQPRAGRGRLGPHDLPPPLRRPRHARGHRRAQLRPRAGVLRARADASGADFADLFEVKEGRVEKVGHLETDVDRNRLSWSLPARRLQPRRAPRLLADAHALDAATRASSSSCRPGPTGRSASSSRRWSTGRRSPRATSAGARSSGRRRSTRLESWLRSLPTITSDHDGFGALLDRSTKDLAALRLFDPEHPDRTVVAAGAPWFMTLFGRD